MPSNSFMNILLLGIELGQVVQDHHRHQGVIKAVWERIRRNPLRKQKIMCRELNVSTRTMLQIIRDDLHMNACRRSAGHCLDARLKKIRHERAKWLLQWHAANGHENILFTEEKIFTVEEKFNKQCDKIYAHSSAEDKESSGGIIQRPLWYGGEYHTKGWLPSTSVERELKPGQRST